MREHYLKELEDINRDMLDMSAAVEASIAKTLKALKEQSSKLAKEVIEADEGINARELAITDKCVQLIAREQPVAGDLRKIIAYLKAVGDIERMGDYVSRAANRAKDLSKEKYLKQLIDIPAMLKIGGEMLHDSVESLVNSDVELAKKTAKRDEVMDSLNKQVYHELLALMLEENKNIKQATKLLFLSRFLERMGDHAVSICSWSIYAVQGEHVEL